MGCWGLVIYAMTAATCSGIAQAHLLAHRHTHSAFKLWTNQSLNLPFPAILQKYLDNFDLSIKIIYILGTLGFSIGMNCSTMREYNQKM